MSESGYLLWSYDPFEKMAIFPPDPLPRLRNGPCRRKGSTKRTLCGIVLFKLNTFLVMFLSVPVGGNRSDLFRHANSSFAHASVDRAQRPNR
jgi:hypothetical protein